MIQRLKLALFWAIILLPAMLFAQEATPKGVPPEYVALAVAAVPFVIFLSKLFVEKIIPDALIVRIRDEWIPMLAPIVGVLIETLKTGEVNYTYGVAIGLAGVGLHQIFKTTGIHGAIFDKKKLPVPLVFLALLTAAQVHAASVYTTLESTGKVIDLARYDYTFKMVNGVPDYSEFTAAMTKHQKAKDACDDYIDWLRQTMPTALTPPLRCNQRFTH